MIWVAGEVVAEGSVTVSVSDRVFEHGLGLFETFRTWNGQAVFLDRHLSRMRRSAEQLGLTLNPADLPDERGVRDLLESDGEGVDRLLRITLSGGLSSTSGGKVWMRSAPLPPSVGPTFDDVGRRGRETPAEHDVAGRRGQETHAELDATGRRGRETRAELARSEIRVGGFWTVDRDDPLARHKSLNYWRRRLAHEEARAAGHFEWLSRSADGAIWEGSRTNIFAVVGSELWTSPLSGPIVPGILRAWVVEHASELGIVVREEEWDEDRLNGATEVFLTNSVRGLAPVGEFLGRTLTAPGPVTRLLQVTFQNWLDAQGNA